VIQGASEDIRGVTAGNRTGRAFGWSFAAEVPLVCLFLNCALQGQSVTGRIAGSVQDVNGAGIRLSIIIQPNPGLCSPDLATQLTRPATLSRVLAIRSSRKGELECDAFCSCWALR
jgi:hypothetical protein